MKRILFSALTCALSSCGVTPTPIVDSHSVEFDMVELMHTGVVEEIKGLSEIGRKEAWIKKDEYNSQIKTVEDLDKSLNHFGDEHRNKRGRLIKKLGGGDSAHHFGFDCDFSVIVFFDANGKQTYIYPESYAAEGLVIRP